MQDGLVDDEVLMYQGILSREHYFLVAYCVFNA